MIGIECALEGRLGKEPEVKTSKAGNTWCSFSVAVGDEQDFAGVQWVSIACFGEHVELARQLPAGSAVYIEGRIKLSSWTGSDGTERHGLQVAASLIQPLAQLGRRRRSVIRKPARSSTEHFSSTYHRPLREPIPF